MAEARFTDVFRIEQQGEDGSRFRSLLDATAEPPMSPEGEIRGIGGCLAECHPDEARWVLTVLGRERIEREIRGVVARDSDTALACLLAEDINHERRSA